MSQDAFNALDEMFDLVPEQNIGGGTYVWVCDYAGGKFYTKITPNICFRTVSNLLTYKDIGHCGKLLFGFLIFST